MKIHEHVQEEILEAYVLRRLQAEEREFVEDHILICEPCQKRLDETRQFVRAAQIAAARIREQKKRGGHLRSYLWNPEKKRPSWAVVAMASLGLALGISYRYSASPVVQEVSLMTTRGGEDAEVKWQRGLRLKLKLSLQGVEPTSDYQVVVVDGSGRPIWRSGTLRAQGPDVMEVDLPRQLARGAYWVRLFAGGEGERLLREYPLRVQ
ncbi:MAG: zf-HC2 domain-containing protein [Bryobacteraceae bacterium]|nr:zf-HC2 domain-containing protein [Bryobacteraceae bacterium]MDW8377694.1 zf-HC2 domain-containing protein [Bryobacterales bacterium]